MSAMGPQGLREAASQCYHKAHHASSRITELDGYDLVYQKPFFDEFVVQCPVSAKTIIETGRQRDILPGLDCQAFGIGRSDQLLVAVTEKRTVEEIDALVQLLAEVA